MCLLCMWVMTLSSCGAAHKACSTGLIAFGNKAACHEGCSLHAAWIVEAAQCQRLGSAMGKWHWCMFR
jgi:hypothetical protein